MKADWSHLDAFRKRDGDYGSPEGVHFGAFSLMRGTVRIFAIASDGSEEIPWEHVSCRVTAYRGDRIPTWEEMCWVKDQFWGDDECVVQFHPPRSEYVNNHSCVLHLWKPTNQTLPQPPSIAVGIKGLELK